MKNENNKESLLDLICKSDYRQEIGTKLIQLGTLINNLGVIALSILPINNESNDDIETESKNETCVEILTEEKPKVKKRGRPAKKSVVNETKDTGETLIEEVFVDENGKEISLKEMQDFCLEFANQHSNKVSDMRNLILEVTGSERLLAENSQTFSKLKERILLLGETTDTF